MKANKQKTLKVNRHDELFKHHFGHKEIVADFLRGRLRPDLLAKIDLTTLTKKPDTFLPTRLRNTRTSDCIWDVKTKDGGHLFFVLHLEAQSTYDRFMALRCLEYHVAINRVLLESGQTHCQPVLTFVIYHGLKKWEGARSIAQMYKDANLYLKELLFMDFLIDIGNAPKEKLQKDGLACYTELLLSRQAKGSMKEIVEDIMEGTKERPSCCEELALDYMLTYCQEEKEILKEMCKFAPERTQKYKTMFERTAKKYEAKGRAKGKAEGRAEGKAEGKKSLLKALIKKGIITQAQAKSL